MKIEIHEGDAGIVLVGMHYFVLKLMDMPVITRISPSKSLPS
jgi:hypothetical protein